MKQAVKTPQKLRILHTMKAKMKIVMTTTMTQKMVVEKLMEKSCHFCVAEPLLAHLQTKVMLLEILFKYNMTLRQN
jgi:hypothetical protein